MKLIADNLNPSNPVFARALGKGDPEPIQETARRCAAAGAAAMDINPGYLAAGRLERMAWLVESVQEVCDLPLCLDSAQAAALRVGVGACRKPPLLNALTAQEERLRSLPALARSAGARLIILLLDERGHSPQGLEERAVLLQRLVRAALEAGLTSDDLICDPVLPHLSWPDADQRIRAAVDLIGLLSSGELLGHPLATMAGLSNLRSGQRDRTPFDLERDTLSALAGAGLDWLLANALDEAVLGSL